MNSAGREIGISELTAFANDLLGAKTGINEAIKKYGAALDNLVSAGVIAGQRVSPLSSAYTSVLNNSNLIDTKIEEYSTFVKQDVIAKSEDLDSQQASELSGLLDSLPGFKS